MESNKIENSSSANPHKKTRIVLIIIVFILAIILGIAYFFYNHLILNKYEETENAYVHGNVVNVNSEIRGTVTAVYINDTKAVKEGDILLQLNPQDAEIALEKAKAALATTVRKLKEQYSSVSQYSALKKQQTIALETAQKDYKRRISLAEKNIISKEELEHAKSAILSSQAALEVTIDQEKTAKANIDGVELINHPTLQQSKVQFIEAWLNYKRTTILAPVSGYVANKNAQVGNIIAPGSPLLSIVSLDQLWVEANFKETQLKNIKVNQDVTIITDVYGKDIVYHGKVIGLSAGTGSAFSLLPAQNATGNWIKIVQRVPVRIALDPQELKKHPLRIGLSTTVKVDIRDQSGEDLYNIPYNNGKFSTSVLTYNLKEAEEFANKIITQNINETNSKNTNLNNNVKQHTTNNSIKNKKKPPVKKTIQTKKN